MSWFSYPTLNWVLICHRRFIPALISALINPEKEVPTTIQLLSATTFVSEVDSQTLSLMVPLLSRGLNEKLTATKRKVAVIIDNMSKLVDSEATVRPFVPKLLPGLIKIEDTIGDPEARGVVARAIKTLREVAKVPEGDGSNLPPLKIVEAAGVTKQLETVYKKENATAPSATNASIVYASRLAANMSNLGAFEQATWQTLTPYVALAAPQPTPTKIVDEWLLRCVNAAEEDVVEEDDEEGEDLCNTTFSLAYGAKILLNTATMRLKRGHRYGLCGKNGTGKSTLMNAIVNGQVEGFPSPDVVRTFYVAHDIDGSEEEITVHDWVAADKRLLGTPAEIVTALDSVGFDAERRKQSIGALSGGWKMKLALARAMLFKADILLMDEPTNQYVLSLTVHRLFFTC